LSRTTICIPLDDYLTAEAIKGSIGGEGEIGIRANGDLLITGEAKKRGDINGTRSRSSVEGGLILDQSTDQ
jgi:hypothetical protein